MDQSDLTGWIGACGAGCRLPADRAGAGNQRSFVGVTVSW
jgi:hypothetical protein